MIEKFVGSEHTTLEVAAALLKLALAVPEVAKVEEVTLTAERERRGGRDRDRDRDRGHERGRSEFAPARRREPDARGAERGMTRLFLNVGEVHLIGPGDIVGAIAGETGLPGSAIGRIDMYDTFSLVDVPADEAQYVIQVLRTKQIKGNRLTIHVSDDKGSDNPKAGGGFKPKPFGGRPSAKLSPYASHEAYGGPAGKFKKKKKW
jgi:ATP-dependent RNA helicase DeaD